MTLLAVAGLVSVHDDTWTTDRVGAARRWSRLHPGLEADLITLLRWSDGHVPHDRATAQQAVDGVVQHIITAFTDVIGLWR